MERTALEQVKLRKNEILARVSPPQSQHCKDVELYSRNLNDEIRAEFNQEMANLQREINKQREELRKKLAEVEERLLELARVIATGTKPQSLHPWQGANVIITNTPMQPAPPEPASGGARVVVTMFHLELSWLFESLRDAFFANIDHASKIEFYGRLANAANRLLQLLGENVDVRMLSLAVLHEAFAMLKEMGEDKFEYLMIAVGKTIADDFMERTPERGFYDIEHTILFFNRMGLKVPNT